jgi:hypothetical protein
MQKGPELDGHTIKVPSRPGYYRKHAVRFYRSHGFTWDGSFWWRDTRHPWKGKKYSPEVWLSSVRKKYFNELYPQLKGDQPND